MTAIIDLASLMSAALDLAERGAHVFPVDHPSLRHCAGAHPRREACDGKRGKHPACAWSKASSNDPNEVARLFGRAPRNVGIDCGRSGLLVLDEDEPGGIDRLRAAFGADLPPTFTVSTGRGEHRYFRQPPGLPFGNGVGLLAGHGVDVRGRGGFVVGPGSLHAAGLRYEVADPSDVAEVPAWLGAALRPPQRARPALRGTADQPFSPNANRAIAAVLGVVLDAGEGSRNSALFWASCRLYERVRGGQISDVSATGMLTDVAQHVGLPATEAQATIGSARRTVHR